MKTVIGIDPGKSGFICVYNEKSQLFIEIPSIGSEIDVTKLSDIIYNISDTRVISMACLEDVHAIFGASATSTFQFGRVVGLLEGILAANDIPYIKVSPKTWQKEMWQGVPLQKKTSSTGKTQVNDTKKNSLIAFSRLFPTIDARRNERCEKPDDNKVDSALIALYCYRHYA